MRTIIAMLLLLASGDAASQSSTSTASQSSTSGHSNASKQPPAADYDAALSREFAAREHEWMAALRDRDYDKAASFLGPEYVLIVSDSATQPVSRERWISNLPIYTLHEFTQRDVVARRLGDTVVVSLMHRQKATVGPRGRRMDRSGDFWLVDVWRQIDGQWKVVSRYSGSGQPTSPRPRPAR